MTRRNSRESSSEARRRANAWRESAQRAYLRAVKSTVQPIAESARRGARVDSIDPLDPLRLDGDRARSAKDHLRTLFEQALLASFIGLVAGAVGALFQYWTLTASRYFLACGGDSGARPLLLAPIVGLAIVFLYRIAGMTINAGTDRVIDALTSDKKPSLALAPAIFIASVLTQFVGGSAGREGAALQLGGCIGLGAGRLFRLDGAKMRIAILCGMSGGFAAVFGAPLAAVVFALEIACVGVVYYPAFFPSIVSALVGYRFAKAAGFPPFVKELATSIEPSFQLVAGTLALGLLCGLVCIFYCSTIRWTARTLKKRFPNDYQRAFAGGVLVVASTLIVGTFAYNGTGFSNLEAALNGKATPWDFLLKTLLTAATLGAGFKGGEIVPAFAVGATFGCAASRLLGLDPTLGAALGMIAVFGAATNCPLAALVLAVETFGAEYATLFALACGVGYMTSGHAGLYRSQRILFSKKTADPFESSLTAVFHASVDSIESETESKKVAEHRR